jgi:methionyl aminopeptidase
MPEVITRKTPSQIQTLRAGGRILASVLFELKKHAKPGVTPRELDRLAAKLLRQKGAEPAFKGYSPQPGLKPFPGTVCVSVNWTVVHGIPNDQPFKEGDIISFDLGVIYKGLFTDAAITIGIGKLSMVPKKLIRITEEALYRAILQARPGNTTGDIGYAIQQWVERAGFSVIKELVGHGVGYAVHEPPYVPNFGSPHTGIKLFEGMVIAIEPMVTSGSGEIEMLKDGSFVTKDRQPAAHFEHTVAITKRGPLILTK